MQQRTLISGWFLRNHKILNTCPCLIADKEKKQGSASVAEDDSYSKMELAGEKNNKKMKKKKKKQAQRWRGNEG